MLLSRQGHTNPYPRTADSDVVILAVYHFQKLGLTELWAGSGSDKTFKQIPIHHICQQLGTQRCQALLFFYTYMGCDVTSALFGMGIKTGCNAWANFAEVMETFIATTQDPTSLKLDALHMRRLERLTVLMYSRMCSWMHPSNPACLVPAYKMCTACCSFHLEVVSLKSYPHFQCNWTELGMECQNQEMDAILDWSTRCQLWMHTAIPLWVLGCMQGQLQVQSSWNLLWATVQVWRRSHK